MFLMKMKISKAHPKVRLDMSASILYLGVQERDGGVRVLLGHGVEVADCGSQIKAIHSEE